MEERILQIIKGEDSKNPLTDEEIASRLQVFREDVTTVRPPGEHGQVRRYPEQRVEKKSVNQFRERFRAVCTLFRFAVRTVRKRAGRGNCGGQEVNVKTDIKTEK